MTARLQDLAPGTVLVSRGGARVAVLRIEARSMVVGESDAGRGKRLLKVPVNGGEPILVVRTLQPVRDNTGRWLPGQELNGRYSQADLDAGVLTPTDEIASEEVPQDEPKKRAGIASKEAVVSETTTKDPAAGEPAAEPQGGVDAPVVKERKTRPVQAPDAMVVGTYRSTTAQRDRINAYTEYVLGKGKAGAWVLQTLLAAIPETWQPAATPEPDPED